MQAAWLELDVWSEQQCPDVQESGGLLFHP